ncbi:MAG: hypothetical protein ACLQG3_02230 [Terracidiphilus sp.]
MRSPAKCAAWLLPLLLAGCDHLPIQFHKHPPLVPLNQIPIEQPSEPIELSHVELPPAERLIAGRPIYNMRVKAEPMTTPVRHRRPAPPLEVPIPPPETAVNPSPAVSAIGELSSGDAGDYRWQTQSLIDSIERGVNGINRGLTDSEQKTAEQIREFLKQARTALATGDVDGAHTLAAKAKVLLDELTK